MQIEVLKSKIHRVKITEADLDYIGSVTIDENLMEAANLIENEKVDIYNYANGERFHTYGPASKKVKVGDDIIIASYAMMDFEAAKIFKPYIVFPDSNNQLKK
jgi:aspartate 1-decarboxylase